MSKPRIYKISYSLVLLALSLSTIFYNWAQASDERARSKAIANQKLTNESKLINERETAMELVKNGCVPLINSQTLTRMETIPENFEVVQDGSDIAVYDGQTVCSLKGDVSIIRDGRTSRVINVGSDNLESYQRIYSLYLPSKFIY